MTSLSGKRGADPPQDQKTDSPIFSGYVTSRPSVTWFIRATAHRFNLHFASFQLSDEDALSRYCRYLHDSKFELKHLAIISEDETAFGTDYSVAGISCRRLALTRTTPQSVFIIRATFRHCGARSNT